MGVPLYPSTESPTLFMGPWDTIGHHLGSLLQYTVLVSHPVQLTSRHTAGHSRDPVTVGRDGTPGLGSVTMLLDILGQMGIL